MTTHYLACDLGAESGRLMLGTFDGRRLMMEELHRFPNAPIKHGHSLHWNIDQLYGDLKNGLRKAAQTQLRFTSISTDSWGVDYLFLAADGSVLSPVFHYRDPRCFEGLRAAEEKVLRQTIFAETGVQFMPLNSVYQLMSEAPARWQQARTMLGIGDAFNYFLSGVAKAEVSFASTTQLYNPLTRSWSKTLLQHLGLPPHVFPEIIPSGQSLGPLRPELAAETGLGDLNVIASCSHDTGAAVVAVPVLAGDMNWAYLSSGTWSLMGVELHRPIVTEECRALNFTNEIGYGHSVRLLKNIGGLWIVQECRRQWAQEGLNYDYPALTQMAAASPAFASIINPADDRFIAPDEMPARIAAFCQETNQPVPSAPGAFVRCVFESLALLYRRTREQLEHLTGKPIGRLHIVGGGGKNHLLNQFTANALRIPVLAGPVEATAAGNILVQALGQNHIPDLAAARQIIADSFEVTEVNPQNSSHWDQAYERFLNFV